MLSSRQARTQSVRAASATPGGTPLASANGLQARAVQHSGSQHGYSPRAASTHFSGSLRPHQPGAGSLSRLLPPPAWASPEQHVHPGSAAWHMPSPARKLAPIKTRPQPLWPDTAAESRPTALITARRLHKGTSCAHTGDTAPDPAQSQQQQHAGGTLASAIVGQAPILSIITQPSPAPLHAEHQQLPQEPNMENPRSTVGLRKASAVSFNASVTVIASASAGLSDSMWDNRSPRSPSGARRFKALPLVQSCSSPRRMQAGPSASQSHVHASSITQAQPQTVPARTSAYGSSILLSQPLASSDTGAYAPSGFGISTDTNEQRGAQQVRHATHGSLQPDPHGMSLKNSAQASITPGNSSQERLALGLPASHWERAARGAVRTTPTCPAMQPPLTAQPPVVQQVCVRSCMGLAGALPASADARPGIGRFAVAPDTQQHTLNMAGVDCESADGCSRVQVMAHGSTSDATTAEAAGTSGWSDARQGGAGEVPLAVPADAWQAQRAQARAVRRGQLPQGQGQGSMPDGIGVNRDMTRQTSWQPPAVQACAAATSSSAAAPSKPQRRARLPTQYGNAHAGRVSAGGSTATTTSASSSFSAGAPDPARAALAAAALAGCVHCRVTRQLTAQGSGRAATDRA